MKEMIFKERNKKITVDQLNFIRNNKDWHIRTEIGQKTISNTFNKRQILPDLYNTVLHICFF
jgi:UDP-2,3-diacylglucosamine pyrophosphatase LpxH